jgi:sigma-E factor negative regulatory protein RseB
MRAAWLAVALTFATPAYAKPPASLDAMAWLQRMYAASQKLSFSGTFIYQQGMHMETSRIVRVVDANGSHERVEVLDGMPREILRDNDEVVAYLPGTMTVKVEKRTVARPFPGLAPENVKDVVAYYNVRKGDVWRVAGSECQMILLEPKDAMRYGQRLCADIQTGMLLKAQTLNDRQEVIEQFAFTQIRVGTADRAELKSRFSGKGRDWHVEQADIAPAKLADSGWTLKSIPAGYRKVTEVKRRLGGHPDVGQIVLSDGMSAVSVFIEPASSRSGPPPGASRVGATNVYTRRVDDFFVTVVGEVPPENVKAIADGVELRRAAQ